MTNELPTLDRLIDAVRSGRPDGTELERIQDAVALSTSLGELGDHLVGHFVDEARTAGQSWATIGTGLGLTRQAVQKRYSVAQAMEAGTKFFDRVTPSGKYVIVHAQDEARARQSDYIRTEHLLLGIVAEPECTGARALDRCGAPGSAVAAAINGRIGIPTGTPRTDKLPFTPKAKSALEHSLRESLKLGRDHVGTGHFALACLNSDGITNEIMRNLGVDYDSLRNAVQELSDSSNS